MSLLFAKLVVYLVVALRVVTLGIIALDRPRFLRIRRMFIVHRWLLGIEARYRGWRDGRLGIPRADEEEAPPEVWKLKRQGDGVGRRIGAKWVAYDLRLKGETQGHEVERRRYARKRQSLEAELREEDERYRERREQLDRKVRDDELRHADDRWRISTPVYVGALLLIFIGEFPLNAVAFNLFGEERVLTWVMTAALAASLIVCAHALGVLWRKQRPTPRDELIAKGLLVSPFLVILGIGLVRQVYVTELDDQTAAKLGFIGGLAVFVAMNALIFVAAFAISYLHHDPETHGVDRVAKDVKRAERRKKRAQRRVDRADWLTEHFDNLKLAVGSGERRVAGRGEVRGIPAQRHLRGAHSRVLVGEPHGRRAEGTEATLELGSATQATRRRGGRAGAAAPAVVRADPRGSADSRRADDRSRERRRRRRPGPRRRLRRGRAQEAHHRVNRREARLASAVACSILAVLAGGCGVLGGSDQAEGAAVMLVDTSQSVQSDAARARYDEALETTLSAFREGGSLDGKHMWVGVDRISANSLTESDIRQVELPGKSFNTNPLEHENKLDAAVEELGREFDNIASTPPAAEGTAIVDSLENAARYFANKGELERKYLLLLSDMFEVSPAFRPVDVLTPAGRQKVLGRLAAQDRVPDLRGVEVYVAGAGVADEEHDAEQVRAMRAFWVELLERAGASLPEHRYGAQLIDFP